MAGVVTSPLVPVTRNIWTPNYGVGFVRILEWSPAGDSIVSFDYFHRINDAFTNLTGATDGAGFLPFRIAVSTQGRIVFDTGTLLLNGEEAISGVSPVPEGLNEIAITFPVQAAPLNKIGSRSDGSEQADGQIRNIRLTDLETPSNSRFYRSVIRSEAMPDSAVLVDELGTPEDLIQTSNVLLSMGATETSPGVYLLQPLSSSVNFRNPGIVTNGFYRYRFELFEDSGIGARIIIYGDSNILVFPEGESGLTNGIHSGIVQITGTQTGSLSNAVIIQRTGSGSGSIGVRGVEIERVTDGILESFPTDQTWVPVLGTNQAYLGNRTEGSFVGGVSVPNRRMTASPGPSGLIGSFSSNRPVVGSLLISDNTFLQVTELLSGNNEIEYATASGTDEQIQAEFQYPNVFDVDPFDSATEAYLGTFTGNVGFTLGVSLETGRMTSFEGTGDVRVFGSWAGNQPTAGSILTASNGASVTATGTAGSNVITFTVITGTDEQIQTGFQWPNHFTVTPP